MMGRYAGISAGNWPLDGNSNDVSGNANNGFNESNVNWVNGRFGQAITINGSGSGVDLPNSASLRPNVMTIGCWIKGTMDSSTNTIFQNWTSYTSKYYGFILDIDGYKARMIIAKGSGLTGNTDYGYVLSTTSINDDVWHFIIGTFDGSYIKIYVDGILENSVAWTTLVYATTQYPMIGVRQDVLGSWVAFLVGTVDELFLLPYVMTDQDIRRWYAYSKGLLI